MRSGGALSWSAISNSVEIGGVLGSVCLIGRTDFRGLHSAVLALQKGGCCVNSNIGYVQCFELPIPRRTPFKHHRFPRDTNLCAAGATLGVATVLALGTLVTLNAEAPSAMAPLRA